MGELQHALNLGFAPDKFECPKFIKLLKMLNFWRNIVTLKKIVYDSPVKTSRDLEFAMKAGVHINLDNIDEVEKINQLLKTSCKNVEVDGRIGIRLNDLF